MFLFILQVVVNLTKCTQLNLQNYQVWFLITCQTQFVFTQKRSGTKTTAGKLSARCIYQYTWHKTQFEPSTVQPWGIFSNIWKPPAALIFSLQLSVLLLLASDLLLKLHYSGYFQQTMTTDVIQSFFKRNNLDN